MSNLLITYTQKVKKEKLKIVNGEKCYNCFSEFDDLSTDVCYVSHFDEATRGSRNAVFKVLTNYDKYLKTQMLGYYATYGRMEGLTDIYDPELLGCLPSIELSLASDDEIIMRDLKSIKEGKKPCAFIDGKKDNRLAGIVLLDAATGVAKDIANEAKKVVCEQFDKNVNERIVQVGWTQKPQSFASWLDERPFDINKTYEVKTKKETKTIQTLIDPNMGF